MLENIVCILGALIFTAFVWWLNVRKDHCCICGREGLSGNLLGSASWYCCSVFNSVS